MKFSEKGAGGGLKGRSEIFRKFIRIWGDRLPEGPAYPLTIFFKHALMLCSSFVYSVVCKEQYVVNN